MALGPSVVDETLLSAQEKQSVPFVIVALKIMHENYGSQHNDLQQFEQLLAAKMECLGPLDMLMELATRCRDNPWSSESHKLQHPDDMSMTSEDTQAVLDISPYPESIDSNVCIDQFVEDAEIPRELANLRGERERTGEGDAGRDTIRNTIRNTVRDTMKDAIKDTGKEGTASQRIGETRETGGKGKLKAMNAVMGQLGRANPNRGTENHYDSTHRTPFPTGETGETGETEESEESWEFRCECGVEGHNYDDGRAMVQCCRCKAWCHQECVGYKAEKDEEFFCKWCRKMGRSKKRKAEIPAGDPGRSKGGRRGRL